MKRSIVEIVQGIERSMSSRYPACIFRGEPACFEKVSSGLYRTYGLEKGEGEFDIEAVENEMVEKARSFTDRKDAFDILCEIQHRGGRTNQIDFTRDFGVALFFACGTEAGREQEPGRVIMLEDSERLKETGVSIRDITHPIHMAAAQKSVFVSTDSGYLDDRHLLHMHICTIDAEEKQEVLQYLKKSRGVDSRSIFMDISGFIRSAHEFENANAWFFRGRKMLLDGDFNGAIEGASTYLRLMDRSKLDPNSARYLRGLAYLGKGDRDKAFKDLRLSSLIAHTSNEEPRYPLPEEIQKDLRKWCEEQEKVEKESHYITEEIEEEEQQVFGKETVVNWTNPILRSLISVEHTSNAHRYSTPIFGILTDSGYSYRQAFDQSSYLIITWPSIFLDYEVACWWSFHGAEHRHIVLPRKAVPEDFEAVIPPKPGSSASPCKIQVRFFAYDEAKQELKKNDSGEWELVALT